MLCVESRPSYVPVIKSEELVRAVHNYRVAAHEFGSDIVVYIAERSPFSCI